MLKTNERNIVEFLLQCQPGPPKTLNAWKVDHSGVLVCCSGISTWGVHHRNPLDGRRDLIDIVQVGTRRVQLLLIYLHTQ